MRVSPAEPSPGDPPAGVPVHSPVPRSGDRRHDIEPVRPPVVAQPVTPRPSGVLHLAPEAVRMDLGAQGERAAVPGGAVQDRIGGELRGHQDRLVGLRAAAQPNDADRAGTPAGVFGAELRFYRTRAGLSQKDLAAQANVSHDVISKIETGERPPAEDFPPRLDAVPEVDTRGALTRLWDHLKKGHKQRLYGWFQQWADIEAQATVLRWYEPLVVPGLLQTEEYARAILSARPDGNLDDLDEQVAARLARQAILDRTGAPQLWCILDEGVLHRAIGGSKVMRSQLYRLAEVAEHPKTTIQVIRSGGAHAGLLGGFIIADLDNKPPVAYLETAAHGQVTDSALVTAHVALSFDRLRAEAESWAASRDLIRKVAEERWT